MSRGGSSLRRNLCNRSSVKNLDLLLLRAFVREERALPTGRRMPGLPYGPSEECFPGVPRTGSSGSIYLRAPASLGLVGIDQHGPVMAAGLFPLTTSSRRTNCDEASA